MNRSIPTRTLSVRVPEALWQRCEAARNKSESWAEVIRQALAAWERWAAGGRDDGGTGR